MKPNGRFFKRADPSRLIELVKRRQQDIHHQKVIPVYHQTHIRSKKSQRSLPCICPFILVFGPVFCRPVFRVGIIRGETCKNRLVVRDLVVHIFRCGFGFLHPFMGFLPLLQNDRIPCPQIFLGSLLQTKAAVFPYIFNACIKRFSGVEKCHRNSIGITVAFWCRWWDSNPHGVAPGGF